MTPSNPLRVLPPVIPTSLSKRGNAVRGTDRNAISRAVTDSPTPAVLIESARADLVRAHWRLSHGRNPEAALESAEKAAAEVREQVPCHPDATLLMAEIALLRHTQSGANGPEANLHLEDAFENAEAAFTLRPTHPRTLAVRAATTIERAKLAGSSPGESETTAEEFATLAANDELLRREFARWIDDSLH